MPAKRWPTPSAAALAASALLLAAPLLAHAYVGLFARYMADDYCSASALRTEGLLGMQKFFYVWWSGRFAFTLTVGVVELLGAGVVPYLPSALLALWLASLTWAVSQFRVVRPAAAAFALAELIVFATLDDNKGGVYEALYWQTGSLTYLLPLVLLTILAGYLGRLYRRGGERVKGVSLLLCGALAFYAGGFSETSVVMQAAALAVALAACLWRRRAQGARLLGPPLAAALLGSLLALAVIALAPGNQVRRAALLSQSAPPPPRSLPAAAGASIESALAFVLFEHNYQGTAHLRLAALLLPLVVAFCRPRGREAAQTPARAALTIPVAALAVVFACFLPAAYALSREPPFRALIVPQFVLVCALVSWGYALGLVLRRLYPSPPLTLRVLAAVLVAVALAAAPAWAARKTLRQAGKARALAAIWDAQDAEMRAAAARGEERLTTPVLYNIGGTDLMTNDPTWYVNSCAAAYYGVKEIRATPGGEGARIMFGED